MYTCSIICTKQEEFGNEGKFPQVIITVVVVTDAPYILTITHGFTMYVVVIGSLFATHTQAL